MHRGFDNRKEVNKSTLNVASRGSDTTISPKDGDIHPKGHGFDILAPFNFTVTTAIPAKTNFIVVYCCSDIIPKIVEGMPFDLENSPRQLMSYIGNATLYRTRESITYLKKFRMVQSITQRTPGTWRPLTVTCLGS
jgi:hypothetical protein